MLEAGVLRRDGRDVDANVAVVRPAAEHSEASRRAHAARPPSDQVITGGFEVDGGTIRSVALHHNEGTFHCLSVAPHREPNVAVPLDRSMNSMARPKNERTWSHHGEGGVRGERGDACALQCEKQKQNSEAKLCVSSNCRIQRLLSSESMAGVIPGVQVPMHGGGRGAEREQPLEHQVTGNVIAMPAEHGGSDHEATYVFGFPVEDHSIAPLIRNVRNPRVSPVRTSLVQSCKRCCGSAWWRASW